MADQPQSLSRERVILDSFFLLIIKMAQKSIKIMDYHVIINKFFCDIADKVSEEFSQHVKSAVDFERNFYCKFGCVMVGVGVLIAQYLRYQISLSKKVNVNNFLDYFKRKKNLKRFSFQKLKKKQTDYFMFRMFANSIGLIALSFGKQQLNPFVYLQISNAFAIIQLFYQGVTTESSHLTSVLRLCGGMLFFVAMFEGISNI